MYPDVHLAQAYAVYPFAGMPLGLRFQNYYDAQTAPTCQPELVPPYAYSSPTYHAQQHTPPQSGSRSTPFTPSSSQLTSTSSPNYGYERRTQKQYVPMTPPTPSPVPHTQIEGPSVARPKQSNIGKPARGNTKPVAQRSTPGKNSIVIDLEQPVSQSGLVTHPNVVNKVSTTEQAQEGKVASQCFSARKVPAKPLTTQRKYPATNPEATEPAANSTRRPYKSRVNVNSPAVKVHHSLHNLESGPCLNDKRDDGYLRA